MGYWSIVNLNNSKKTQKPLIKISPQDHKRSLNPKFYKIFNLGQKRLLSSLIWIDTMLSVDHEHYKGNDLLNWLYIRLDTITDLDPLFYQAYQYGGPILSVLKDDDLGALNIYNKGLKYFKNDPFFSFYAGTHAYFELQDNDLAIHYLEKIQNHPKVPKYLPSLVSRLKASKGDLEEAYSLLIIAYNSASDGSAIKNHFRQSLYALKSEIDLECLNSKKDNCSKTDFDGDLYLLDSKGVYYAAKKWTPFRKNKGLK